MEKMYTSDLETKFKTHNDLLLTYGCSAASNWKPGPHAVSTIVKCLQSPGCC